MATTHSAGASETGRNIMRILMDGIKGGPREMRLARRNLLLGANGSGKTTITQSIKLVALGYDPALGKRPMDQAAIMREREMIVRLFLEDDRDRAIMRTIRAGENGYEMIADASWLSSSAKPKEHAAAISNLFGRDADEIAQSLDLGELLKLTPMKRAAVLEELLGAVDVNPAVLARQIIHHALIRIIGIAPEKAPEGNAPMMAMLAEKQVPILKTAGGLLVAKLTAHGLDGGMAWARKEKLDEDGSLKKKIAAEKELRAKLHGLAETQPEELDRLARELRDAEAAITAETTRRETWATREQKAATAKHDVSRFFRLGMECTGQLAELQEDLGWDVEEKKASLVAIVKSLDSVPSPKPTDLKEISQVRREAEAARKAAEAVPSVELPSVEDAERLVRVSAQELETAEADPWRKVHTKAGAILATLALLEVSKERSGSEAIGIPAGEIHDIAKEKMGDDPGPLVHRAIAAKEALVEAVSGRREAEKKQADAEARKKKLTTEATALDEKADRMLADTEQASVDAKATFDDTAAELRKKRDAMQSEIEEYEAAAQTIRDTYQEWKEKHKEAQGRLAGLAGRGEEPKGDLEEMKNTRYALAMEKETLEASAGKRAAISELVAEIASAKLKSEVYGAVLEGAKLVRQAGVTEAGAGLTKLMASFLAAGDWPHAPYIRATQKACEIGWRTQAGQEIPIQAMSGGEWALFAASLSAGMIVLRKAEIRILIVEAGEADQDHLQAILKGIEAMGEELSASFVLTHVPLVMETQGWERHEFEREEVAA